jgi:hypothetical protein
MAQALGLDPAVVMAIFKAGYRLGRSERLQRRARLYWGVPPDPGAVDAVMVSVRCRPSQPGAEAAELPTA